MSKQGSSSVVSAPVAAVASTEINTPLMNTRERQQFGGIPMCALIRVLGNRKPLLPNKQALLTIQALGLTPSPTTVHIQIKNGRDGIKIPEVSQGILDQIDAAVSKVTGVPLPQPVKAEEEKPAKKGKKDRVKMK